MTIFDSQFEKNRKELRQRVQAILDAKVPTKPAKVSSVAQLTLAFRNLEKAAARASDAFIDRLVASSKYGDSLENETLAMLNAFGINDEHRKKLLEAAANVDDWNYWLPIRVIRRLRRKWSK